MSKLEADHRLRVRTCLRMLSEAGAKHPTIGYTQYGEKDGKWRVNTDYFTSGTLAVEGMLLEEVVAVAISRLYEDVRLNTPLDITFDDVATEEEHFPSPMQLDDDIPF